MTESVHEGCQPDRKQFRLIPDHLRILQFLVTQSLISGLWLIFVGLFMKQSAAGSYQAVMMQRALDGVQVRQIMTENLITVDWLTSINELVENYIYKHQLPIIRFSIAMSLLNGLPGRGENDFQGAGDSNRFAIL